MKAHVNMIRIANSDGAFPDVKASIEGNWGLNGFQIFCARFTQHTKILETELKKKKLHTIDEHLNNGKK